MRRSRARRGSRRGRERSGDRGGTSWARVNTDGGQATMRATGAARRCVCGRMDISTMRAALSRTPPGAIPREAMEWARDNAGQATPALAGAADGLHESRRYSRNAKPIGAFYRPDGACGPARSRAPSPSLRARAQRPTASTRFSVISAPSISTASLLALYEGDGEALFGIAKDPAGRSFRARLVPAGVALARPAPSRRPARAPSTPSSPLGSDDQRRRRRGDLCGSNGRETLDRARSGGRDADRRATPIRTGRIARHPRFRRTECEENAAAWRADPDGQRDTYLDRERASPTTRSARADAMARKTRRR